jgi:eukaryotic-like serine/threonine-protein kinase
MEKPLPNVKTLFDHALDLATPAERAAYLDEACAGAPDVRLKVEALLRAYHEAGSFLESPAGSATAAFAEPNPASEIREKVGSTVAGRYKLVEQIGEGGMGVVFMAEQQEPVRRLVALKIIRPGMDSRGVLARFEAERQALALMDHPNIAKVLDAGATADGRPFFVMELVKGTPITAFCDANKLLPRQRLELFIPVCQAIQHAHQKGVIHRDIKPSNVLIALYDDRPVPKVIDFGIAKATGQALTEKTLHTGFGTIIGTPEYMSPEQATFNQLDIDTRSDVYALGVLLYELLTGTTPVDKAQLKEAAVLEVLRVVREEEPPRPSVRMSRTQARASIAATRGTDPEKLAKLMRGELDWIVMKSLEKDRNRRYETAVGLARDVERYLQNEMVEARPPSTGYRLRKFVSKHRGAVLAASLMLLLFVAGTFGTTLGMVRAQNAEAEARQARDMIAANLLEAEALRKQALASAAEAEAQRDKAQENERKAVQAAADTTMVLNFFTLTVLNPSMDTLLTKGEISHITLKDALLNAEKRVAVSVGKKPLLEASVRQVLGSGLSALGESRVSLTQMEKAFAIRKEKLGLQHPETVEVMVLLAPAYLANEKPMQAISMLEELMNIETAAPKKDFLISLLADSYQEAKRYEDAIRLRREIVAKQRKSADSDTLASSLHELGLCLMLANRPEEAEPILRESLALHQKSEKLGRDWFRFVVEGDLGNCLLIQKKYADAEPLLQHSFDELKKREGKNYASGPVTGDGRVKEAGERLLKLYEATGKVREATSLHQQLKPSKEQSAK